MRRGLLCGLLGLVILPAACAPAANTTTAHHVHVVVQHLDGTWLDRRVDFATAEIDGVTAMDRSGLEYAAQTVSSGKVVCQVDNEPASFVTCFPQNKPYWALFVATGGKWSSASGGVSDVRLQDGQAMGWHYVPSGDSSPAPPPTPRGA
jgi:hypothetical protein